MTTNNKSNNKELANKILRMFSYSQYIIDITSELTDKYYSYMFYELNI